MSGVIVKIFGREPALILQSIGAVLSLGIALGLPLSTEQAGLAVAVVSAVFGAVAAAATRPVAPQAFVGVVATVAALTSSFGFEASPELIGGLNAVIVSGLALLGRAQSSPATPSAPVV
jgi:hypothetical protein